MSKIIAFIAQFIFVLVLVTPFLIIFILGDFTLNLNTKELFLSLWFTFKQSLISAILTLVFGFLGALGLIGLNSTGRGLRFLEVFIVFPSVVPVLFVILALMNIWTHFFKFPYGVWGIVLVHTVMNVGLVSFMLSSTLRLKLASLAELASVEGCSTMRFYTRCGLKFVKGELTYTFFFIFSLCFTSLSVPMIVGSIKEPVLEILIFEKLRHLSTWPEAVTLSLIQVVLLFLLAMAMGFQPTSRKPVYRVPKILGVKWWASIPLGISLLVFLFGFGGLVQGFIQLVSQGGLLSSLIKQAVFTAALALGVGITIATLHYTVLALYPSPKLRRWLISYVAPSSVLIGFGLLLAPPREGGLMISVVKLTAGIALLFFPICFRLKGGSALGGFSNQYEVARQMGATHFYIFRKILVPQYTYTVMQLAAISAFWASGEFAISSIVLAQDYSISLAIRSFLGSYRFGLAAVYMLPLLAVGGICWGIFMGVAHVYRQKSI